MSDRTTFDLRSDDGKRAACRHLALLFKARAIVDGFLANTNTLDFPPEWAEAVELLRSSDGAKMDKHIKRMMGRRETEEVVRMARRDAEGLGLEDIRGGRIV